jgi:hypothetical protein
LHEPVVVQVTLNNRTTGSVRVDFGGDFVEAFRLSLIGPDGQRRALPPLLRKGIVFGGSVDIAALASYTRPLILNEWISFQTPGAYRVEVSLLGIANSAVASITILPRDARRLNTVCAELARNALEASSFVEASLLARTLSFAVDPDAVPHLKKVAEENDGLAPTALAGLTRIADRSAIMALHALSNNPSKELSVLARGSLGMIRVSTRDESLKREIDAILATVTR